MLGNIFHAFCCHLTSAGCFQKLFKIISGTLQECQRVRIQIRTDVIWVQNVCKGNQQTTLGGKEFKGFKINAIYETGNSVCETLYLQPYACP